MMRKALTHWRDSFRGIPSNVWLLSLVSLVNRAGGMVVAFITLYLTQKLDFGIKDAGYVMTCFGLGAMVGAFSGGKLTDKFGYYQVQFWSLVFNGIILIALLWVKSFWGMCLAIALMSVATECFRPANTVAIIRNTTDETRTRSFSLMRMSFNIGWTIAPALGGIIAYNYGWNWLFWIDGLTCIAAATALRLTMREKEVKFEDSPAASIAGNLTQTKPLHDPMFVRFILFTFLGALVFMQILWTVPVFFKEVYGWNEDLIGWVVALNGVIVFLVEMPLIFQVENKLRRLQWIRIGLALYGISYLFFAVTTPEVAMLAAILYITVISFGEIFAMPFSTSWVSARAKGSAQGQYMAYYTMAYSVANVIAPMLGTQVIAAFGYKILWYAVVGLSLVALAGFSWMDNQEQSKIALETQDLA